MAWGHLFRKVNSFLKIKTRIETSTNLCKFFLNGYICPFYDVCTISLYNDNTDDDDAAMWLCTWAIFLKTTVRSQCLYQVFSFENNWIILCTSILWSFWQKECYRSVFSDLNLISLSLNLCGCWCQVARKDHGGWGEDVGALLWRRDHQEEVVDRVVHSERWLNQTRTAPFGKPVKVQVSELIRQYWCDQPYNCFIHFYKKRFSPLSYWSLSSLINIHLGVSLSNLWHC